MSTPPVVLELPAAGLPGEPDDGVEGKSWPVVDGPVDCDRLCHAMPTAALPTNRATKPAAAATASPARPRCAGGAGGGGGGESADDPGTAPDPGGDGGVGFQDPAGPAGHCSNVSGAQGQFGS